MPTYSKSADLYAARNAAALALTDELYVMAIGETDPDLFNRNTTLADLVTFILANVDGDTLDVDFTPSNYTPDATPAEASDVDDLAAHLYGLDLALGGLIADLVDDTSPELGGELDTVAFRILESKGADVASATTPTLGADGNFYVITGTTTITGFTTTGRVGALVWVSFADVLTLTHHATDFFLPNGGSDITTAAGDVAAFRETAAGKWTCMFYQRASGQALVSGGGGGLSNVVEDVTPQLGGVLDTNGKMVQWSKGADVASASALAIGDDGNFFKVTGTTTINTIANKRNGTHVKLWFEDSLTLTHSTDLFLPAGGGNITTEANDIAVFVQYASGDWRCVSYQRADGTPLTGGGLADLVADTSPQLGGVLDANGNQVLFAKGADVASASALSLGTDGNTFNITGTTTINTIGTLGGNTAVFLRFAGALTLTHSGSLVLPNDGSNISTAAGDWGLFVEFSTGVWHCVVYQKADGGALQAGAAGSLDAGSESGKTIASDAVTLTGPGQYLLTPESGTGDDLVTINGLGEGELAILRTSGIYQITVTDGTGNISCPGGQDFTFYESDSIWVIGGSGGEVYVINMPVSLLLDTSPQLGGVLDTNGFLIRESKGADVASASSLVLGNDGNYFVITGTTAITSIGTKGVGTRVSLQFAGVLTLTHHATDLILPTGANITTAAGDVAVFREYATGDWRCVDYLRADGSALVAGSGGNDKVTLAVNQTTHGFSVGDVVCFDSSSWSGTFTAAKTIFGLVSAVADSDNFTVTLGGEVTGLTGLTAGQNYYADYAGALSTTENFWFVGRALSTSSMLVAPSIPRGGEVLRYDAEPSTVTPQSLTTTHADINHLSATLTPWVPDSKFVTRCEFTMSGDGTADPLGHFQFLAGGSENRATQRNSPALPTVDNGSMRVCLEFERTNPSTPASVTLKLQGREYSSAFETKVHETVAWDGAVSAQDSAPRMRVYEVFV